MELRKTKLMILILVTILIAIVISDYYNLFSLIGIQASKFNLEFLNIVINSFLILILYIVTYLLIDKENIRRRKNQYDTLKILLLAIYTECLGTVKIVTDEKQKMIIVNKVDFNKSDDDNSIIDNLKKMPFINEAVIFDLSKEGIIPYDQLQQYMAIKHDYQFYVSIAIALFDNQEIIKEKKDKLIENIKKEISRLHLSM